MGERFATDAVGTGPYELVRFDTERGVTLKRHDGYWGAEGQDRATSSASTSPTPRRARWRCCPATST